MDIEKITLQIEKLYKKYLMPFFVSSALTFILSYLGILLIPNLDINIDEFTKMILGFMFMHLMLGVFYQIFKLLLKLLPKK